MRAGIIASALFTLASCGASQSNGDGQGDRAALASCAACHSLDKNGPRRSGPTLAGVIGRPAASINGYSYSPALKGSGMIWTKEALDRFLADPTAVVPGTRMVARIPEEAQRKAVIEALSKL